jgi:hypothetical protein
MTHPKHSPLLALTAAACLLPGMVKKVEAATPEPNTQLYYQYSSYSETPLASDAASFGSKDRYEIAIHQFKLKTPLNEDTEISVSAVSETMSGASPWYILPDAEGDLLLVMSGATIEESRKEVSLDFHSFAKQSDTTLSAGFSSENDYRSISFGFSGSFQFNQKLTSIDYGLNAAKDYLEPTQSLNSEVLRITDEVKNRTGANLGISQVFTKNTLIGLSFSYAGLDGYLSDPYKLAAVAGELLPDARPDVHEQTAVTLMWREFFPSANAALHADYRAYTNNWGIASDTVELSWYQNIGSSWQLIPSVRNYQQTAADFYRPFYLNPRKDKFYSSDYRLSEFSAVSGSLKLAKKFTHAALSISYENYAAKGDNPALISYDYYSAGLSASF